MRALLAAILAAAACVLVFKAAVLLDAATAATRAFENAIKTHEQVTAALPGVVRSLSNDWKVAAQREGHRTRELAAGYLTRLDSRLAAMERDADDQLSTANASLANLAKIRDDLKPALDHSASLVEQVDHSIAPHLDCRSNGNCWPAAVTASLGGFKMLMGEGAQAARRVDTALPGFLRLAESMVSDSSAVAANVNRLTKPRWYDRLLGYGLNGAVLYRNLNPATSVTVKGAQVLSGVQPLRP